ncbi:MAG TPA: protein kinase, partial [Thermoanaerobaculia bacterium]
MIGRTIGHYRILDRLGEGGMGVVYRAEDTKLGRSVALKFLPPEVSRDAEAKSRFEREARAASLLDHPNICTIYGFGEAEGGQLYIAMAHYDGESLAARIALEVLPLGEAIRIVEQIARGLGKAHSSGIVHRDIKPANVMLTSEGVAKILDFGLAKLSGATGITRSHTSLGTIAYMAPEQIKGEEVGLQADIWALGIVLFELLTGKRPFRGEYTESIQYAILNEQPATITDLRPDLPSELDPIIKRMLRKDPLQRYQTASEVLSELEPLKTPSSGAGAPRRATERQKLRSGAKLGPYQIEKPLGSGGMGDVYLATDTRLQRQVAIKVLPPEFSEDAQLKARFQREAKTISQLSHPNICPLFDVGEQEGLDFLVMEYLEGETLADKKGPLPIPQVLKIGIQIAEALAAAHRQGIVHRDLKPGNVMITKSGTVKLVDFGLAKEVGAIATKTRGSDEKPLTDEGMIVGTLAYMAPEQIERGEADARTDIFALGAMLYEMVTGKRAFEGKTKASLIVSILERDPIPITTLKPGESPVLVHVIDKCLAKDPDKRWQSALDIATEFQWIEDAGRSALIQPNQRRRFAGAALAALVVVAAALVAGSFLAGRATVGKPEAAAVSIPRLTQLTFLEGVEGQPSISPDGTAFVYVADTAEGNSDIFFQRVGGETAINLTKGSTEPDYHPAFSPDGQTIAYRSGAPAGAGGIYLIGATGESRRRLTNFGFNPAWSPDGKYLAVATEAIFRPTNRFSISELWRIDVASGVKKKIAAAGDAVQPSFSPNGRRIAYWGQPLGTGKRVLYTMPVEGDQAVALTD